MVVPVTLVLTAELKQVVAFQHANVVTKKMIFPIPEAGARLLGVDVVRSGDVISLLAKRLESGA